MCSLFKSHFKSFKLQEWRCKSSFKKGSCDENLPCNPFSLHPAFIIYCISIIYMETLSFFSSVSISWKQAEELLMHESLGPPQSIMNVRIWKCRKGCKTNSWICRKKLPWYRLFMNKLWSVKTWRPNKKTDSFYISLGSVSDY